MSDKFRCSWLIGLSFLLTLNNFCGGLRTDLKCQKTDRKPCVAKESLKFCYVHKIDGLIAVECESNCTSRYPDKDCPPVCLREVPTCKWLCGREECLRDCFPRKNVSTGEELCQECDIARSDCKTYILFDHRVESPTTTNTIATTTSTAKTTTTASTTTTDKTTARPSAVPSSSPIPSTKITSRPTTNTEPPEPPAEGFAQSGPYIVGCVVITLIILLLLYCMVTRNPETRPVLVYSLSDSSTRNPDSQRNQGDRSNASETYTAGMSNLLLPKSPQTRSQPVIIKSNSSHNTRDKKKRRSITTPRSPASFSSSPRSPGSFTSTSKNPFSVG